MNSIGRNDKCPCGSGLKYKKCCLEKNFLTFDQIECDDRMRVIVKSAYDFIKYNDYRGGCHLISAVIYILLKEEGYSDLVVKTGVVYIAECLFDHSWVEYQGKKIDITVINTLQKVIKLPPVFLDKLIGAVKPLNYKYGVNRDLDAEAKKIVSKSLGQYILDGESQKTVVIFESIAQNAGMKLGNAKEIIRKYIDTYRVISRDET